MRRKRPSRIGAASLVIAISASFALAGSTARYPNVARLSVNLAGLPETASDADILLRMALPWELIDAAGSDLNRLFVVDDNDSPIAYRIEPAGEQSGPRGVRLKMSESRRFADRIEYVFSLPAEYSGATSRLILDVADEEFDGDVSVEFEGGGEAPQHVPVFRRSAGAGEKLDVEFPAPVTERVFRLTVRSDTDKPLAVVAVYSTIEPKEIPSVETIALSLAEITDGPEESWIRTRIPHANVEVRALRFVASAPVTARKVEISSLVRDERGASYRSILTAMLVFDENGVAEVPVNRAISNGDLLITVFNGQERPMRIVSIDVRAARPSLILLRHPGVSTFRIFHGAQGEISVENRNADLAGRAPYFTLSPSAVTVSEMGKNPTYDEPLDKVSIAAERGAVFSTHPWRYRKSIAIDTPGIVRIDLDAEAAALAAQSGDDLRIVEEGYQVPYLRVNTVVSRTLEPVVERTTDGPLGRWLLQLGTRGVPVTYITARAGAPIFKRRVTVFEEIVGNVGKAERIVLGEHVFVRTGTEEAPEIVVSLRNPPRTDRIQIEVDNGDNAALELRDFRVFYRSPQLLFKKSNVVPLSLYFGNDDAAPPDYDLSLIAGEIISKPSNPASLGAMEIVNPPDWWRVDLEGPLAFWLYWGALVAVTVGLIVVIARLLPASPRN